MTFVDLGDPATVGGAWRGRAGSSTRPHSPRAKRPGHGPTVILQVSCAPAALHGRFLRWARCGLLITRPTVGLSSDSATPDRHEERTLPDSIAVRGASSRGFGVGQNALIAGGAVAGLPRARWDGPLVGRGALLKQVEAAAADAARGAGSIVLLAGEAGIGKTTAAGTLALRVRYDLAVSRGSCVSDRSATSQWSSSSSRAPPPTPRPDGQGVHRAGGTRCLLTAARRAAAALAGASRSGPRCWVVLTRYDEFPVHQSPYPFSVVPVTDYSFDDGYYFGVFSADEGVFLFQGMRVNPNNDMIGGYAGVMRRRRPAHRAVQAAVAARLRHPHRPVPVRLRRAVPRDPPGARRQPVGPAASTCAGWARRPPTRKPITWRRPAAGAPPTRPGTRRAAPPPAGSSCKAGASR